MSTSVPAAQGEWGLLGDDISDVERMIDIGTFHEYADSFDKKTLGKMRGNDTMSSIRDCHPTDTRF
ncbi:alkaline proteinase precursor [Colletotrichum scovillei]|uniref:Alkaline proteinase n=1 Tax=Colletotrichum scovillei TaxID=1209932 RepID=A0A9P7QS61_9PEZI|nr:alkaline proteinase precursor [Colletotrichum scovillei]KAG7040531.1 alkaline proteinase precursor [Colletotrichum scovillei]KAG7060579.1 alkaline proteinase precursor [Colletotrichum scovillei]